MNPTYSEGRYRGRITTWGMTVSKNGTPAFAVTFDLLGMVQTDDPEAGLVSCPAGPRTVYRYITDKTMGFIAKDLEQLGYDRQTFDDLDPESRNAFDFFGKEIPVYCKHSTYEGKQHEQWNFDWGARDLTPLESSEMKKLNAMFAKALPGKKPAKPAVQPAPATGDIPLAKPEPARPATDSSVPF